MLQVTESRQREQDYRTGPRVLSKGIRRVAVPLTIYGVTRIIDALFLSIAASRQHELVNQVAYFVRDTIPASPGYWGVMASWDGQWYKSIALDGYPAELPMSHGHVDQNVWAFYPLFPTLARAVMRLTGLPFEVAGSLLSLVAGAFAVATLYVMLRRRMSAFASGATIAMLCTFPTAPVLQVGYSESISILVLLLTLGALQQRQYGIFAGLSIVLSLARPITAPLALVTVVHWLVRWRGEGLARKPGEYLKASATVAVAAGSTFLWPTIAWIATGQRSAFFATQEAWKVKTGDGFLARSLLGQLQDLSIGPALVTILPLGVAALVALTPGARRWGVELRSWTLAYPLYIAVVTQPTFSVLRYSMIALVPWWQLPQAGERSDEHQGGRLVRWIILAMLIGFGLVCQFFWVTEVFTVDGDPARQGFP